MQPEGSRAGRGTWGGVGAGASQAHSAWHAGPHACPQGSWNILAGGRGRLRCESQRGAGCYNGW